MSDDLGFLDRMDRAHGGSVPPSAPRILPHPVPDWQAPTVLHRLCTDLAAIHTLLPGGMCAEDGMTWPCRTLQAVPMPYLRDLR